MSKSIYCLGNGLVAALTFGCYICLLDVDALYYVLFKFYLGGIFGGPCVFNNLFAAFCEYTEVEFFSYIN